MRGVFSEFAEEMVNRGWNVKVLTSNRYCRYPEKKVLEKKEWWKGIFINRVYRPSWSQGNYSLRFFNSIWMMIGWIITVFRMPAVDVMVIGTDPYFSALLFPIFRFFKRSRILVHWCFDVYPEIIIAQGAKGVRKMVCWENVFTDAASVSFSRHYDRYRGMYEETS